MLVLWIHGYVISTKGLAEIQNISYYKARKYCKELEKEGLIEHIRKYIPAEFDYETGMELQQEAFWNIGWRTTKKALENEIWKQEETEEERIRKEVWGEWKAMSNIYNMDGKKKVVITEELPTNITYKEIMKIVIENATEEGSHKIFCNGGINMCPSDVLGCTKCWTDAVEKIRKEKSNES